MISLRLTVSCHLAICRVCSNLVANMFNSENICLTKNTCPCSNVFHTHFYCLSMRGLNLHEFNSLPCVVLQSKPPTKSFLKVDVIIKTVIISWRQSKL